MNETFSDGCSEFKNFSLLWSVTFTPGSSPAHSNASEVDTELLLIVKNRKTFFGQTN
jgi:hypothetical protein